MVCVHSVYRLDGTEEKKIEERVQNQKANYIKVKQIHNKN